jgi:hypothetical protein
MVNEKQFYWKSFCWFFPYKVYSDHNPLKSWMADREQVTRNSPIHIGWSEKLCVCLFVCFYVVVRGSFLNQQHKDKPRGSLPTPDLGRKNSFWQNHAPTPDSYHLAYSGKATITWCVSQFFVAVTNIWEKQFQGGRIYFGSWLQRFQSVVGWLHCFR